MPTYRWKNKKTGEERDHTTSISTIDSFLNTVGADERDDWDRMVQPTTILKRIYTMGARKSDGLWQDGLEIAKLEEEALALRPEKRKPIEQEIKKIKKEIV